MMENSTVALVPEPNEMSQRRQRYLQSRVCIGTSIILLAVSMLTMRITLMKISYWRFPLYSPAIWGSVMFLFAGVLILVKERKNLEFIEWAAKMMCILCVVLGGIGIIVESAVIASETKCVSAKDEVQRELHVEHDLPAYLSCLQMYGTSITMVLVVLIESTLAVVSLILACKSSHNCCTKLLEFFHLQNQLHFLAMEQPFMDASCSSVPPTTGNNEPQFHSHSSLNTLEVIPGLPMYEENSNEENNIPPTDNPPAYTRHVDDETDTNTSFLPLSEMYTLSEPPPYEFTNPPPYSTAPSGTQHDESTT